MNKCKELISEILDGFDRLHVSYLYDWVESDEISAVDIAVNGRDEKIEVYRVTVTSLPYMFGQKEHAKKDKIQN